MITCWILLGAVIALAIISIVAVIKVFISPESKGKYWENRPRIFCNEGFIFDVIHLIFWVFDKLAIINIINHFIPRRSRRYMAVDAYIVLWFSLELCLLLSIIFSCYTPRENFSLDYLIVGILLWRLIGLFRVWVFHFVIAKDWNPISLYRTLILVFIGYIEITISYAALAFILREHFIGITCWQQALDYSIRNAITMGSPNIGAKDSISYSLLWTQIMFVLLFLTAVVNRIISRR